MTRLSSRQQIPDADSSTTSLSLTHKALSDVSCLIEFHNLEKLDLAFNSLTSLQGLSSCVNLKWLSVVQNKLQSLKGIETLSKLTVLNAGKNKLKSMDEVTSLVSLRALILNDNEIVSICKLDQMKELNTLVLSRNPIREIGNSLVKLKSITKLSLSNCYLHTIDSSLKSCIEMKELRLAHNDIKALPAELAFNKKLQNLDLGNNVISRWSDIKVLTSLVNLKNLNLQGNPVVENDKLAKKVQKILPNLHVFNGRPKDKSTKDVVAGPVDDFPAANEKEILKTKKKDHTREKKSSTYEIDESRSGNQDNSFNLDMEKDLKQKKKKRADGRLLEKEVAPVYEKDDTTNEKKLKRKRSVGEAHEDDGNPVGKTPKGVKSRKSLTELDVLDSGETSFVDLFATYATEGPEKDSERTIVNRAVENVNLPGDLPIISAKKNKSKNQRAVAIVQFSPGIEIGMGGPSTWGDD